MINSATLTDEDVACNGGLTSEDFYTKAFAFGITAVLYTAFPFFVCHKI